MTGDMATCRGCGKRIQDGPGGWADENGILACVKAGLPSPGQPGTAVAAFVPHEPMPTALAGAPQSGPPAPDAGWDGVSPQLVLKIYTEPRWTYPQQYQRQPGVAGLDVWTATSPRGRCLVAVVTELGDGVSVTNGAADIWSALHLEFAAELAGLYSGGLYLIEHWPADQCDGDAEHLDLVHVTGRHAEWARLWPTPDTNPGHAALDAWMAVNGAAVLSAGGAR